MRAHRVVARLPLRAHDAVFTDSPVIVVSDGRVMSAFAVSVLLSLSRPEPATNVMKGRQHIIALRQRFLLGIQRSDPIVSNLDALTDYEHTVCDVINKCKVEFVNHSSVPTCAPGHFCSIGGSGGIPTRKKENRFN